MNAPTEKAPRKTKAQRELERATEMLRKPGARLMLMHTSNPAGCSKDKETKRWPDVCGGKDGLFPGRDQTWRFA